MKIFCVRAALCLLAALGLSGQTMNVSGTIDASQVSSGTLGIARIPTGTTGTTVPFGNDARFLNATSLSGTSISAITGLMKLTAGVPSAGTSSDVIATWTGTCSSSTFLRGDGSCATPAGSGTVNAGTTGHLAFYASSTSAVSDLGADYVFTTHTLAGASTAIFDMSAASATAGIKLPSAAGAVPTADGSIAVNTTNHTHVFGANGTTVVGAVAATGTGTATTCSNQAVTAISGIAAPTCTTLTSAYVDTSIAKTGTDINTSNQVTATHLAAALPVAQGGTGTGSTLTGLVRGSATSMTAAELSGDATTSGSNAVTVAKVNGTSVPATPSANQVLVATSTTAATWQTTIPAAAVPTAVPVWNKYTIAFGSVNAASTAQTVTIVALTARQAVCGLIEKTTTAFAGTSITGLTATVGDSNGTSTTYSQSPYNLLATVSNTNFIANNVVGMASFAGGNVTAGFTSVGANLSALTAGSVDFDVCVVTLP